MAKNGPQMITFIHHWFVYEPPFKDSRQELSSVFGPFSKKLAAQEAVIVWGKGFHGVSYTHLLCYAAAICVVIKGRGHFCSSVAEMVKEVIASKMLPMTGFLYGQGFLCFLHVLLFSGVDQS